jgi:hypothetical protein
MGLRSCCEECYCNYPEHLECKKCEGTGFKVIPDNQIVFINVYTIDRRYGGPEEGGWWYDWFECVEVFPVKNSAADDMVDVLEDEHEHRKWGDISSVLGGEDVRVWIQESPKESETKRIPHYE